MLVYPSQYTVIDVLNDRGDEEITHLFEICNFGLTPITHSAHPFWFREEQREIVFECCAYDGEALQYEVVRSSAIFREIRVHFRRPLESLDTLRLKVAYRIGGAFPTDPFYCLRPRSLTNKIGLTVMGAASYCLKSVKVTRESSDGFMKDGPDLDVSSDGTRRNCTGNCARPGPGTCSARRGPIQWATGATVRRARRVRWSHYGGR